MGYTHYWYRDLEIPKEKFHLIVEDFRKILPLFKVLDIPLGNGIGVGNPIINDDEVVFNGLRNCGHQKRNLPIPWPAQIVKSGVAPSNSDPVVGAWFAGVILSQRACNGDCSYETFYFPRVSEEKFNFCKTAFRPYDLAVTVFLVIAKHHLGSSISVKSDGDIMQWKDAIDIVCNAFGYYDFELD